MISYLIMALFIIAGTMLYQGKWANLIAGYNTLSKEEKEKYDTPALCRFYGKMMFVISFSILLWEIGDALGSLLIFMFGTLLFIVSVVFTLVYSNSGSRFKK